MTTGRARAALVVAVLGGGCGKVSSTNDDAGDQVTPDGIHSAR